jgi:hypothetical protein
VYNVCVSVCVNVSLSVRVVMTGLCFSLAPYVYNACVSVCVNVSLSVRVVMTRLCFSLSCCRVRERTKRGALLNNRYQVLLSITSFFCFYYEEINRELQRILI